MDNFALIFGIVFLCTCIIAITFSLINNRKYKKFLLNIKAGDIFIWDSIDNYNRLNNLDKDNPFVSPKIKEEVLYPRYTIIISDVKMNDNGVLWAAYNFIEHSNDIKNKRKYVLYRELEDLIQNRIKIN